MLAKTKSLGILDFMAVSTLTEVEQRQLLRVTLEHRDGLRDHVIILLALKTGLRQAIEILALNVGDVFEPDGSVKRLVILPSSKGSQGTRRVNPMDQSIGLAHEGLRDKLTKLYLEKKRRGHDLSFDAPLFVRHRAGGRKTNRVDRKGRLTARALHSAWIGWQKALGWHPDTTRFFRFHDLRHTAISRYIRVAAASNPREALVATKRFARHKSTQTTEIYLHETEEEYLQALRRM